jgi:hypothetical protein
MTDRRYLVGERVLVSRAENGADHEEATVVDFYELLINQETRPMVVVDFDDGERKWMTAREPDVLAIDLDEAEAEPVEADVSEVDEADGENADGG